MTKIVVGVEASEHSEDAVAFARDIARATDAEVVLAAAHRHAPAPTRAAAGSIEGLLEADARSLLEPLREGFDAVSTRAIADGSPARALQALAEEEEAALIVVGSSRRGRVGRVVPGSTGMRLAHGAPCAVAVVSSGYRTAREHRFDRIGCAFDTSGEAATALDAAAAAAAALRARLRVIHVFDAATYVPPRNRLGGDDISTLADYERSAQEDLDEAIERLPANIAAEPVFAEGIPADVLAAQSEELDLLFAGSRGYGPSRAVLLGGVTHDLLHRAACPVVLLPRDAEPTLRRLFQPGP